MIDLVKNSIIQGAIDCACSNTSTRKTDVKFVTKCADAISDLLDNYADGIILSEDLLSVCLSENARQELEPLLSLLEAYQIIARKFIDVTLERGEKNLTPFMQDTVTDRWMIGYIAMLHNCNASALLLLLNGLPIQAQVITRQLIETCMRALFFASNEELFREYHYGKNANCQKTQRSFRMKHLQPHKLRKYLNETSQRTKFDDLDSLYNQLSSFVHASNAAINLSALPSANEDYSSFHRHPFAHLWKPDADIRQQLILHINTCTVFWTEFKHRALSEGGNDTLIRFFPAENEESDELGLFLMMFGAPAAVEHLMTGDVY